MLGFIQFFTPSSMQATLNESDTFIAEDREAALVNDSNAPEEAIRVWGAPVNEVLDDSFAWGNDYQIRSTTLGTLWVTTALACLLNVCCGCSGPKSNAVQDSRQLRMALQELHEQQLQTAIEASQQDRWYRPREAVGSHGKEIAAKQSQLAELQLELSALSDRSEEEEKTLVDNLRLLDELEVTNIFRSVEGIDRQPRPLNEEEAQSDLFFKAALSSGSQPGTLQDVLEKIDSYDGASSLTRSSFLLGEGSQIPVSNVAPFTMNRGFRFVVTWARAGEAEILLGTPAGARAGFLEVIAWDSEKQAFNYYERINAENPTWFWKGDSSHALKPRSRGNGCFRCHVNGGLVMRELRQPWNNWHSEAAQVSATVPDEIRRQEPRKTMFRKKKGAESLEAIVRHGIERWDSERAKRAINGNSINNVVDWTRQLTTTTSVNLISSQTKSERRHAVNEEFIDIPPTFFLNVTGLRSALSVELPVLDTRVERNHFEEALEKHEFKLFEDIPDTFFAFSVPEPSHEDNSAIRTMLSKKIVSSKLAASILMVDFPNPIYSAKRKSLFEIVDEVTDGEFGAAGTSDVSKQIETIVADAISTSSPTPSTVAEVQKLQPAEQFLFYYRLPNDTWEETVKRHVAEYFASVRARLQLADGVEEYLQLAVARRAQFAAVAPGSHMILESKILFPSSTITNTSLEMGVNGRPRTTTP